MGTAGEHARIVRVVLVSPGDVPRERAAAQTAVEELNRGAVGSRGCQLSLWRWETDARPGMNRRGPQGLIDEAMNIEDADVVVGVFWKRFGTPIEEADSGTEHELRRAWAAWKERGRPEVMVYFGTRAYSPKTPEELAQWKRVLEFKQALPEQQFWWPYRTVAEFERLLRQHLMRFVLSRVAVDGDSTSAEPDTQEQTSAPEAASSGDFQPTDLAPGPPPHRAQENHASTAPHPATTESRIDAGALTATEPATLASAAYASNPTPVSTRSRIAISIAIVSATLVGSLLLATGALRGSPSAPAKKALTVLAPPVRTSQSPSGNPPRGSRHPPGLNAQQRSAALELATFVRGRGESGSLTLIRDCHWNLTLPTAAVARIHCNNQGNVVTYTRFRTNGAQDAYFRWWSEMGPVLSVRNAGHCQRRLTWTLWDRFSNAGHESGRVAFRRRGGRAIIAWTYADKPTVAVATASTSAVPRLCLAWWFGD